MQNVYDLKTPDGEQGDRDAPKSKRQDFQSRILGRDALKNLPNPEPLIDGVLDQGTTGLLYGPWASGKSFIALDWAASIATGRPWQGRTTEQRRVLYVAAEGAFGLKGRLATWETAWQQTIPNDQLCVLPIPANLTDNNDINALMGVISDGKYDVVFFDTLARCMVGADENSARDCGLVVDSLSRLREATPGGRGVALGVHHTGKDGKTLRGSSALEGGVDTVYSVARDGNKLKLDRQKRKDGPQGDSHDLTLTPFPNTDSCIVERARATTTAERSDQAQQLIDCFKEYFQQTGATGKQLHDIAEEQLKIPRSSYYRIRANLLEEKLIINTGSEQRPFYKLGPNP